MLADLWTPDYQILQEDAANLARILSSYTLLEFYQQNFADAGAQCIFTCAEIAHITRLINFSGEPT